MTYDLWKLIQTKEKVLRRKRRHPTDEQLIELLAHVSKKLQKEKQQCKRNYHQRLLEGADQRSSWKIINDVLGKETSRSQPTEIYSNGNSITDGNQICSAFNDYFCNIGANLAATISTDRNIFKFGTLASHQNSMFLSHATVNEVVVLINSLKTNTSPGPDNITVSFVKEHHHFFAAVLADVFNEIIITGQYPDCLKIARVVPIFKTGDVKELSNYRPISCLSVLDKIIEKLIVSRIVEYTNRYDLIYAHQYGFRRGSSTLTASCDLMEDIYDTLDNRHLVGALFVDLKKAFDTIDHELLVHKLDTYGIRGMAKSLIESYLANRSQFVSIGEFKSSLCPISTGVPQGSNLGPVLFLLFINDLAKLKLKGKPRLFADDTSVFYKGANCEAIQRQIKHDAKLLNEYFGANLLSMNISKTKYMLIHSPRRRIPAHARLEHNGHEIEEVQEYTFLGLT